MNKTMLSILKVLDKRPDRITGSREISRQLTIHGIDLTERTVRYHLRILDEKGFTRVYGKEGRKITPKGREELSHSLVSEKVGFVISRIETLSYLSDFDIISKQGNIILNVTFFPESAFSDALRIMKTVFASKYSMSDRVVMAKSGEYIGDIMIPEGHIGFGTICSVTINSILLKAGIPISSKFGGVLQIEECEPTRFVALISYDGSSLDPLEIFIKSSMTDVRSAVKNNSGKILASFREIPLVCAEKAQMLKMKMNDEGIGGILAIGNPNQDLLEMPVGIDKAGMVVVGGLNPVAAVEEAGISTRSKAMSTLYRYTDLVSFKELL
ncbi:MAG: NrpR regulatory domain-containing protein [Nitrospirota bacterium]